MTARSKAAVPSLLFCHWLPSCVEKDVKLAYYFLSFLCKVVVMVIRR